MCVLGVVRPDRTAVRMQKRRIFLARSVVERLINVAGDGGAVFTFELHVFGCNQALLFHRIVVGVRDARQLSASDSEYFTGKIHRRNLCSDFSGLGYRVVVQHEASADGARDFSTTYRNTT